MSLNVVVLEDDPGYEALLRNIAESRGWAFTIGASYDAIVGSLEWADVAIVDLDAAEGVAALRSVRALRPSLPAVAITSDEAATPQSTTADAVVSGLPSGLVDAVLYVTAPLTGVIDLRDTDTEAATGDRPWYATS